MEIRRMLFGLIEFLHNQRWCENQILITPQ
jgi:hypothetical protein